MKNQITLIILTLGFLNGLSGQRVEIKSETCCSFPIVSIALNPNTSFGNHLAATAGCDIHLMNLANPIEIISLKGHTVSNASPEEKYGKHYTLIIGVREYTASTSDLDNPIKDAVRLQNTIIDHYTFEPERAFVLKNPDRKTILGKFRELKNLLSQKDQLLIFFAGHGQFDQDAKQGYWIPANSMADESQWISNSDIRDKIHALNCRHVLVVSDACFGGQIVSCNDIRSGVTEPSDRSVDITYGMKSRRAITSTAADQRALDRSVFMDYLINFLQKGNTSSTLFAQEIYTKIHTPVINNSPNGQKPLYNVICNTGDEDGDFIFFRRSS